MSLDWKRIIALTLLGMLLTMLLPFFPTNEFLPGVQGASGSYDLVLINEFMAAPSSDWDGDGLYDPADDEWVEMFNPGDQPVNVTGLWLGDGSSMRQITGNGAIPSMGFLMVFGSDYGSLSLNNGGDDIELRDTDGTTLVESITYGSQNSNISEGRETDGSTHWVNFAEPTPGARNQDTPPTMSLLGHSPSNPEVGVDVIIEANVNDDFILASVELNHSIDGSPWSIIHMKDDGIAPDDNIGDGIYSASMPSQAAGIVVEYRIDAMDDSGQLTSSQVMQYAHTLEAPDILINEILPKAGSDWNNDGFSNYDDEFAELLNNGSTLVNLGGWELKDLANSYTLGLGVWLDPGQRHVMFRSELGFALNDYNEVVSLFNDTASLVDSFSYSSSILDVPWGAWPEGSGAWQQLDHPTPGNANSYPYNAPPEISSVELEPLIPSSTDSIEVSARVIDPEEKLTQVRLGWTIDNVSWTWVNMTGDPVFSAFIPAHPHGTILKISIKAADASGNISIHDTMAVEVNDVDSALFINEIMAAPDSDWDGDGVQDSYRDEWIEIFNAGAALVNLTGYVLGDPSSDWVITNGSVPPGGFMVFFGSDWGSALTLNNGGEAVTLISPDGLLIDSRSYSPMTSGCVEARVPDGNRNWELLSEPTPGARNIDEPPEVLDFGITPQNPGPGQDVVFALSAIDDYPTLSATLHYSLDNITWLQLDMPLNNGSFMAEVPGQPPTSVLEYYIEVVDDLGQFVKLPVNSSSQVFFSTDPQVIINEFMALPKSQDWDGDGIPSSTDEWVELFNAGSQPVDLSRWILDDLAGGGSSPYTLPFGTQLGAGEYLVLGKEETGLGLNNAGDELNLYNEIGWLVDNLTYDSGEFDVSWGICNSLLNAMPDNLCSYSDPTPGLPNPDPYPTLPIILLSSIFYSGPEEYGLITILNPGTEAVDISYWRIGDGEGTVIFPNRTLLDSGAELTLAYSGALAEEVTGHAVDFEYMNTSSVPELIRGEWPVLANSGDEVFLKDPWGRLIDAVVFGSSERMVEGWAGEPVPWPGKGKLLIRRSDTDTNSLADWTGLETYSLGGSNFDLFTTTDTSVTVFSSPDSSHTSIISLIDNATTSITLGLYELTSPTLTGALADALDRGVSIRILMEGNPVGWSMTNGDPDDDYRSEPYTQKAMLTQLDSKGARIRFMVTNQSLGARYNYLHAKYMIVDSEKLLVGSENFKPSGIPSDTSYGNRGWFAVVKDSGAAGFMEEVFAHDWNGSGYDIAIFNASSDVYGAPPQGFILDTNTLSWNYQPAFSPFTAEGVDTSVILAPDTTLHEDAILGLLASAQDRIYVELLDLNLEWNSGSHYSNNLYLEALIDAAERGCRVLVLLDSRYVDPSDIAGLDNHDAMVAINDLAAQKDLDLEARLVNLDILGLSKVHNKGLVVDGMRVLISSINWNRNSVTSNREVALILESEEVGQYFERIFFWDWNRPPIVDLGNDLTLRTGQYLSLNDSTCVDDGVGTLTFTWDIGDGEVYVGSTLDQVFTEPGIYEVTLTVSDGQYLVADSLTVVVHQTLSRDAGIFTNGLYILAMVLVAAAAGVGFLLLRKKPKVDDGTLQNPKSPGNVDVAELESEDEPAVIGEDELQVKREDAPELDK